MMCKDKEHRFNKMAAFIEFLADCPPFDYDTLKNDFKEFGFGNGTEIELPNWLREAAGMYEEEEGKASV